jgi:hypothetical protein
MPNNQSLGQALLNAYMNPPSEASEPNPMDPQALVNQILGKITPSRPLAEPSAPVTPTMSAGSPSLTDRWNNAVSQYAPSALQNGLSINPVPNAQRLEPANLYDMVSRGSPLLVQMLGAMAAGGGPIANPSPPRLQFDESLLQNEPSVSQASTMPKSGGGSSSPPLSAQDWSNAAQSVNQVKPGVNDVPRLDFSDPLSDYRQPPQAPQQTYTPDSPPFPPKPFTNTEYGRIMGPNPNPPAGAWSPQSLASIIARLGGSVGN